MPALALLAAASIASLNLCADEYLLLLARPGEVASVSNLSHDPFDSPLWRLARRHHANDGTIEQVVGRRPAVALAMGGGGRARSAIAARLGIRTVNLKHVGKPADVADNLRSVAAALGAPGRAAPWLLRLERLRASAPRQAADAIWVSSGGQSFAAQSAGAHWLRLAGLRQRDLGTDRLTLETLLARPPAVLVRSEYRSGQLSQGSRWLEHPIVRRAKSRRIVTDGRAWTCLGPLLIPEIERLRRLNR